MKSISVLITSEVTDGKADTHASITIDDDKDKSDLNLEEATAVVAILKDLIGAILKGVK